MAAHFSLAVLLLAAHAAVRTVEAGIGSGGAVATWAVTRNRTELAAWCDAQTGLLFSSPSQLGNNKIGSAKAVGHTCYMQLQQGKDNDKVRTPLNLYQACEAYNVPAGYKVHTAYLYGEWMTELIKNHLNDSIDKLAETHGYVVGIRRENDVWYNEVYSDTGAYDATWSNLFHLEHLWDDGEPIDKVFALLDHNTWRLKAVPTTRYAFGLCQAYIEGTVAPMGHTKHKGVSWFRRSTVFKGRPSTAFTLRVQHGVASPMLCTDMCAKKSDCSGVSHSRQSATCMLAADVFDYNSFMVQDEAYDVYQKLVLL